jgi:hypothetical protein
VADIFMYVDETGNLDYNGSPSAAGGGASTYFGFGTAVFTGDQGPNLEQGLRLRAELEAGGLNLRQGFHAVNDSARTRSAVFPVIAKQGPRFDTTLLCKANAYPYVRAEGEMRLYKLAWYMHFKHVAQKVSTRSDRLFVIAAEFGTAARRTQAKAALEEVCRQVDRNIILCVWSASTSWGLQVADYGLWAVQRTLEGKTCTWYDPYVKPTLATTFFPWGQK